MNPCALKEKAQGLFFQVSGELFSFPFPFLQRLQEEQSPQQEGPFFLICRMARNTAAKTIIRTTAVAIDFILLDFAGISLQGGRAHCSFYFLFTNMRLVSTAVNTIPKNKILDGVIWKGILSFFFPILLGTFFQQLYNTVDAVVVGQFLGKQALAAVGGGTSTIVNLLIGFFTGLASGASVVISQRFGSGRMDRVSNAIHTSVALSLAGGVAITAIGLLITDWSLNLIGTPEDVFPLASSYMKIYFAGSLTLVVYNMASGIFRALGDSKHPLYFLITGCLTNIVLDVVFVGFIGMGVEGAAYATVISQLVSVVLSVIWLRKLPSEYRLSIRKIRFVRVEFIDMLKIGIPAGIQSVMYSISNIIIQANINSFGTDTAAAYAAYGKLDAAFWMIVNAFGIAITTFVGQNYGAGKTDRVKKGVNQTLLMAGGATIFISAVFCLFGRYAYRLFTTDEAVIEIGMQILLFIVPTYITYLCIEVLSGAIRGAGKALVPTIISITGVCLLRIIWLAVAVPVYTSVYTVCAAYPVTWTVTSLMFILYYKKGAWLEDRHHTLKLDWVKKHHRKSSL